MATESKASNFRMERLLLRDSQNLPRQQPTSSSMMAVVGEKNSGAALKLHMAMQQQMPMNFFPLTPPMALSTALVASPNALVPMPFPHRMSVWPMLVQQQPIGLPGVQQPIFPWMMPPAVWSPTMLTNPMEQNDHPNTSFNGTPLHAQVPPVAMPLLNQFLAAATLLQQQQNHLRQMALFQQFFTPMSNGSTPIAGSSSSGGGNTSTSNSDNSTGPIIRELPPEAVARMAPAALETPRARQTAGAARIYGVRNNAARQGNGRAGKGQQKAKCEICGKKFGRPWLLSGHARIHNGEKPYKCDWPGCGRAFADRSNCQAHKCTHRHEKPFKCDRCGKAFKLKAYRSKHFKANVCRNPKPSDTTAT